MYREDLIMPRPKILRMAAINITARNHPEGVYESILKQAQRSRLRARVLGDRFGVITQIWASSDPDVPGIHGVISTFTNINFDEPWFNEETLDEASESDINNIDLPSNLRPNLRRCVFIFDRRTHTISFDINSKSGGIAPASMERFLTELLSNQRIVSQFGAIKINILHEEHSVSDLLSKPNLRQIFIHTGRPNPGDYDATPYEDLKEFLDQEGADIFEQTLSASNDSLTPSPKTKQLAEMADENGYITIRARTIDGQSYTTSTKNSAPHVEQDKVNLDVTDFISAAYTMAERISRMIRRRRGRRH